MSGGEQVSGLVRENRSPAGGPGAPPGGSFRLSPRVALAVVVAVALGAGLYAWQPRSGPGAGGIVATAHGAPVYEVIEGQAGYDYPYDPHVLHVKAGHPFAIRLVDHLGGCGLDTVFPGLGQDGQTAVVNVPVGATRTLSLEAPHVGTYVFHCGSDMYFGKIIAA